MMLEIKEILWSDTMWKPWTNVTYLELEMLQNGRYSYADEEQIQKFEGIKQTLPPITSYVEALANVFKLFFAAADSYDTIMKFKS